MDIRELNDKSLLIDNECYPTPISAFPDTKSIDNILIKILGRNMIKRSIKSIRIFDNKSNEVIFENRNECIKIINNFANKD